MHTHPDATATRLPTLVAALLLAAIILALWLGNPYSDEWPLKCPLHQLTGWQCPLCGLQRQANALAHLRLAEAWRLNPALLLAYPYLGVLLGGQLSRRISATPLCQWCYRDRTLLTFLALMAAWGVARNLPPLSA